MKHKCPICKKSVKLSPQEQSEQAKFFPFCSRRCKLIDLGAWLDDEYRITSGPQSQQTAQPPHNSSDITPNNDNTQK